MQEARAMTLIEHLTLVEETRSEINRKHNLVDVMFLVISAIMSGAEGWNDIETYGDSKIDWLRQHRPFANGIPRRHTVARILRCIVIDTLLEALLCWVNEQRTHQGKPIIAFDGKVLRGSFRGNAKEDVLACKLRRARGHETQKEGEGGVRLRRIQTAVGTSD
jgi:hypothetical protein